MALLTPLTALALACVGMAAGCEDSKDTSAALAPGGGANTTRSSETGMRDGGPSVVDSGVSGDAPSGSAVAMLNFFSCEPLVFGDSAPINAPDDFAPTYRFAGWLADCSSPTIAFGLSEGECVRDDACSGEVFGSDTVCLEPGAHRLTYYVEAAAILNGDVTLGTHVVSVDSTAAGITTRYRRPGGLVNSGLFGNCLGSDGTFDIENIGVTANTPVGVTFNHVLSACADSDALPQTVTGSLRVTLTGGQSEACLGSR